MHICHLSLDYPTRTGGSGVGTQVHTLAHALVAEGHKVTVVALSAPGEPDVEDDHGVHVRRIHPGNFHWYCSRIPWLGRQIVPMVRELEYSWAALRAAQRLHAEDPVDVVEGTETGMLGVALWHRLPLLIRLHGEEYTFARHTPGARVGFPLWLARQLQRMAIRRAGLLISPSVAHAREIDRELKAKTPYTEVVPNNVPLMPDALPDKPAPVSVRSGHAVLCVGRLELRKGIAVMVDAARQISEQVPGTRFLFAGLRHSSLPDAELKGILDRSGLNGQIELLGHIPRQRLTAFYDAASVCVCPSYYETFGLSALEGMAAGVPVVVTSAGAFPEVVADGVSGIVVRTGDSEALCGAVVRLLQDHDLRARLGNAGREHARNSFEVGRQLRDNLRLYRLAAKLPEPLEEEGDGEHIFFSPHLDDAAISCGGLIELLRGKGAAVTVITVFAKLPEAGALLSGFARHLHRKWGLADDALEARRVEDRESMKVLDVKQIEYWNFPDAPYRRSPEGTFLYTSYQQIKAGLAMQDDSLQAELFGKIAEVVGGKSGNATFYFPAAIGGHVDHQMIYAAGVGVAANGARVRFYEDWPYVETYRAGGTGGWVARRVEVPLDGKVRATRCYRSQFRDPAADLMSRFSRHETYWELPGIPGGIRPLADVYQKAGRAISLREMRRIAARFRWHNLDEILPAGHGICLDFGAGQGRHRALAESRGYRWTGLEKNTNKASSARFVQGDAERTPFAPAIADCVIAWQVMEYVEQPEQVFAEAARVLVAGGVFCGSVSFLEPVHGRTYYGISPLLLERLLQKHGFGDIAIKPGVGGLALLIWTWLSRLGGPGLGRFAFPIAAALAGPPLCTRFLVSWLWKRFGRGSGFGMRRVLELEPLEFAGHVLFVARKIRCT